MNTSARIRRFQAAFREGTQTDSPRVAISSLTGSAAAFAAASLALDPVGIPFVLVVTSGLPEADAVTADLEVLGGECAIRVLEFPLALEGDRAALAARLKAAAALGAYRPRPYPLVVVAPFGALPEKIPASAAIAAATLRLAVGEPSAGGFAEILGRLRAAGYERQAEVTAVGQYSVRGGVLDVWSPDAERPVRAEFFGDDLDSLRTFDPALQTSVAAIGAAEFPPVDLSSAGTGTLLAAIPDGGTILWLEHNEYSVPSAAEAAAHFRGRQIFTGDPAPRGVPTAPFQSSPLPGFAELGVEAARNPELLEAARGRLAAYLVAAGRKGALVVEDAKLGGGFEVPGLVVVAKSDRVFAHRRPVAALPGSRRILQGERLTENLDIEPGEYVVHLDHGIGRFAGTTEIEVAGQRSEVFSIEYADGAMLHVPVDHAHLLSRYVGVKGQAVKLHRLDGRRWVKEKAEAQRAVQDLASSLLETQARRACVPGFAYDVEANGVAAFEAAFPYETTPDQEKAIADVKRDMARSKPMDRLICGDAGYGKTEVAMRAAFIAAMNGKQTVLLAPTTVLAEQHYETFLARFDGTPVRIEAMSRFQSEEARRGTRSRLASGATDIVIGTHALLSAKVQMHDLGLIVIDEEQRFGVRHKEFLKRLRATADVLTMSATPIPRTLYLSMTGARDLSLLRTPPRERVATETKIVRDTDATVAAAIGKELARGGQVYYLHNRVLTIDRIAARLRALAPAARIEVAHGQMPSSLLAAKMRRFARGETNVLLCTTIVESGLDIPRANTILVDRADHFGIAELYQLRGRVGRSSRQGFAYFLLPPGGTVDADARARLDALKKHAGLGAGFDIAMRDLEIRGAGNLLGSEQSGHIAAVGFQLYCQLLQRTVARIRGEKVPDLVDVALNFDFLDYSPGTGDLDAHGACLPYAYVEDEAQRMDFHRRLAETSTIPMVKKLRNELADRYGRLPKAAERLVKLAEFRVVCAQLGISAVTVRKNKALFYRRDGAGVAFVGHLEEATPEKKLGRLLKTMLLHAGGGDG
ncbi:MAG: transcription-repair coupling factor [Kiritimatiellia bacterium]